MDVTTYRKGTTMKQEQRDFIDIQKEFFGGVIKMYFAPLAIVRDFFNVYVEFGRQMLICLFMDSEEYAKLQDLKLSEEEAHMVNSMDNVEEFENNNFNEKE